MTDPIAISFWMYTLAIVGVGLYSSRFARQTAADFFLADRGLGAWVAALSSSASAESGWVTLGLVGMAYRTGLGAMWIIAGTWAAFLFNWFVLAWRLRSTAADTDALTLPDVLATPFHGTASLLIRLTGIVIILTMLTAYVAAQLNAAGKTFNGIFHWDYVAGVLVGAGIILVYTVTGGFRAIAWTDVVQGTFMIITVTVIPVLLIVKLGGPATFWARLSADAAATALTDPFAGKSGLALIGFLALWLGIPLGNPGQPHVLVRLMAIKDRRAVLRGGIISSTWVLALFSGAVLLGMAARGLLRRLVRPGAGLADHRTRLGAGSRIHRRNDHCGDDGRDLLHSRLPVTRRRIVDQPRSDRPHFPSGSATRNSQAPRSIGRYPDRRRGHRHCHFRNAQRLHICARLWLGGAGRRVRSCPDSAAVLATCHGMGCAGRDGGRRIDRRHLATVSGTAKPGLQSGSCLCLLVG